MTEFANHRYRKFLDLIDDVFDSYSTDTLGSAQLGFKEGYKVAIEEMQETYGVRLDKLMKEAVWHDMQVKHLEGRIKKMRSVLESYSRAMPTDEFHAIKKPKEQVSSVSDNSDETVWVSGTFARAALEADDYQKEPE